MKIFLDVFLLKIQPSVKAVRFRKKPKISDSFCVGVPVDLSSAPDVSIHFYFYSLLCNFLLSLSVPVYRDLFVPGPVRFTTGSVASC